MRRFFSIILLLFLVCSQFQIGSLYANNIEELATEKQRQIEVIDTVEQVIDTTIEKIEQKTNNRQIEERLEQKEQEVEEYLQEVKQDIQGENNTQDIKEKVQEAKKVVVLKVVSGVTQYEDIEENISEEVADTPKEREEARETIQDSLETSDGDYTLIIKTKLSQKDSRKLFHTFDTDITLSELYSVGENNYFEVTVPNRSIFRQEMMENIENGILPETYLGIDIVQPEVFGIEDIQGEDIETTWGIEQYQTYNYFSELETLQHTVKVGVIDTGIDYRHPDLIANTQGGYDFVNDDTDPIDDQGHGTHVAGTIGANINGVGIIGVNPYVELVPLKICNAQGFCPSYAALRALDYAREENIDIVNMSLGGRANPNGHSICEGISAYTNAGGIVVTAAGNSNINTLQFVPGGCEGVISVAAIDENGNRAPFSNYGSKVDIAAPGVDVYSTSPGNSYRNLSGTSMATPHITGLISILKSYDSELTTEQIEVILKNYPKPVNTDSGKDIASGIDITTMMQAIHQSDEGETNVEAVEEIISLDEPTETPELPKTYSQKDTHTDDNEQWVLQNPFSPATSPTINFGEIQEILETNTDTSSFETIDIDEISEPRKPSTKTNPLRVYDENGQIVEDAVEVNTNEELIKLIPNTGEFTTGILQNEKNQEYDEKNDTKEVFIGNSEEQISHINSIDEGREMIFNEKNVYAENTGQLESPQIETLSYHHDIDVYQDTQINSFENQPVDENGYIIGAQIGNSEVFDDGIPVHVELTSGEVQKTDTELLIDGAQKSLQINNTVEVDPIQIEIGEHTSGILEVVEGDPIIEEVESQEVGEPVEEFSFDDVFEPIFGGEIPIPDGFDTSDIIESDDIQEGIINNEIDLEEDIGLGIQGTYYCNIKLGETCYFRIYNSANYDFSVDVEGKSTHHMNSRTLYIVGRQGGTVHYQLSQSGRVYHNIYVTIKPAEPLYEYDVEVEKDKRVTVDLSHAGSYHFVRVNDGGYATLNTHGQIEGRNIGKLIYYVYRYNSDELIYKINIDVVPVPPTVIDIEIYKGQKYRAGVMNAHLLKFEYTSSSPDIGIVRSAYNIMEFTGNTVGSYEVNTTYEGDHTYQIFINVLPIPTPQEYEVTIEEGKWLDVYFPEEGNNYGYSVAPGNTGFALLYNLSGYVSIHAKNIGNIEFHVKDAAGFTHYIIHTNIIPKLPETRNITMYQGQTALSYIDNANDYTYSSTDSSKVSFSHTSSKVYITGNSVGNTQIILSQGGHQKYILDIEIQTPPQPQVLDVQTQELHTSNVHLQSGQYLIYTLEKEGNADIESTYNQSTGVVEVKGLVEGNITATFKDSTNLVKYILNITVVPFPPVPHDISIFETRSNKIYTLQNQDTYSLSQSGIVSIYRDGYDLHIQGISPGSVELYIRDWRGRHYKTFNITITPKPEVTVYPVELYNGQGLNVYLPESIDNYTVTYSGTSNMLEEATQYDTYFYVRTQKSGQYNIHLQDENGFDIHRIEIVSGPIERHIEIVQTEYFDSQIYDSWDYYSDNPQIAYIYGGDELYGANPGTTQIQAYDDNIYKQKLSVTVLPIPDPIEINCIMYKHEKCRLDYYHGGRGIQFTTDNPEYIQVEYGNSTTRVSGDASGTATVQIKAHNADYIKYVMNVTILPDPVQEYDCSFPLGLECQTKWYDNEGEYAITTSDPSIVDVRLERYTETFAEGTRTMERTKILGKLEGTADVYIYQNGDHKATVHVTVTPPAPPIIVEDGSVTVRQGESIEIQILSGGGNYQEESYETDMIAFDVDSNPDGTGDYSVLGKIPGITYPVFRDQYHQTYQVSVNVTDTTLDLHYPGGNSYGEGSDSTHSFTLTDGNPEYVTATNFHTDVTYTKSNSNIRVNKEVIHDDQIAFLVTPLVPGSTTLTLTDNEGNVKDIEVVVGEGEEIPFNVPGNLIVNGGFNGQGETTGTNYVWLESKEQGWAGNHKNDARGKLQDGRLLLETTGPNSYVQGRNIVGSYWNVTEDSIIVEPDTTYILEYDYETEYISGDSSHGFNVGVLMQESDGAPAGEFKVHSYIKTTEETIHITHEFTTSSTANYLNISPILYGHTGEATLQMKAWVDNMSLVELSSEDETLREIDNLLNEFISEVVSQNIELTSSLQASRCELGNSEVFWIRPYHAVCIDNQKTIAWQCKEGYTDLYTTDFGKINSCIPNTKINEVQDYEDIVLQLREISSQLEQDRLESLYPKFVNFREQHKENWIITMLVDDLLNEFDQRIDPKIKRLEDIRLLWVELQKYANDGIWGDGWQDVNYSGKTRQEISEYTYRVMEKVYDYQLDYDFVFKQSHDSEVQKILSESDGATYEEIEQGLKEGTVEGARDYAMQYYDLVNSLSDLSLETVWGGISSVWSFVQNPIDGLSNIFDSFVETIHGIYEKLLVLTGYEGAKGGSYVGTTIGLSTVDPTGKVLQLAGGGFFGKIVGKVDDLIIGKLKYSSKILGQMQDRNWTKSDVENAIKNSYKKGKSTDNYDGKNDPATAYFVSDNQYVVINNLTGDVVQVSDKNDSGWIIDARIYDIK